MVLRSDPLSRGALVAFLFLAGCTAAPLSRPVPPPIQPVAPAPPKPTEKSASPAGVWRYQPGMPLSYAVYGRDGAAPEILLRCDRSRRQVALLRSGSATEIAITTSAGVERFPAGRVDERGIAMSGAIFNAGDAFLDRFAFSRGQVSIASAGLPTLVAPTWAEPARTIEDCRK